MSRNWRLDAIRACAIVMVLLHHVTGFDGPHPRWFWIIGHRGYIGVDIFFVLSGWLIGGQVIRGWRSRGEIDVWRFWQRRWLRTLPAYFAMLALIWVFKPTAHGITPGMLLFTQNYTAPERWIVTWSLCIEEHFYLALPLVFLAMGRRPRLLVAAGLAFLAVSPALRWISFDQVRSGSLLNFLVKIYVPTHYRLEGLVMGVGTAALAEFRTPLWIWMERRRGVVALAGLGVFLSSSYNPWTFAWIEGDRMSWFGVVPQFFGVSLGTALMLPLASGASSGGAWWKSWITWVAEHAYALYLTHTVVYFVVMVSVAETIRLVVPRHAYWLTTATMLAGALVAAWLLRTAVEKPGLRLRDWIEGDRRGRQRQTQVPPEQVDQATKER